MGNGASTARAYRYTSSCSTADSGNSAHHRPQGSYRTHRTSPAPGKFPDPSVAALMTGSARNGSTTTSSSSTTPY
eukprot:9060393-Heterocapsa_arctica.AAC.1